MVYKSIGYTVVLWFIFQCIFTHNIISKLGTAILDGFKLHIALTVYNTFNTVDLLIFTDLIENLAHYLSNLTIMKMLIKTFGWHSRYN